MPIHLQLHPSRRLAWFLFASHAATLGGVFFLSWAMGWRLLLAGLVLLSLYLELRRQRAYGALAWLRLGAQGSLEYGIVGNEGEERTARVLSSTTVWRGMVVLRYRPEEGGAIGSAVILPDSMADAESFRQLRVWLCWRAEGSPPGQA